MIDHDQHMLNNRAIADIAKHLSCLHHNDIKFIKVCNRQVCGSTYVEVRCFCKKPIVIYLLMVGDGIIVAHGRKEILVRLADPEIFTKIQEAILVHSISHE